MGWPDHDRRLRADEHPLRRIALAWLAVSGLLLIIAWSNIVTARYPDPDDVLRLVQVRDLLDGQDWFDLKQHRVDPLGAVPMHWSRLVDLPLALAIGGLEPLLGAAMAERVGVVLVPLLALLVTMLFIGRMAWRLFDVETAGLACLVLGFLPLLVFQFQPLRIDHHGWQIAAVAAAMWAILQRRGYVGGLIAGLAMGVGIAISLELLPVAALFGGVLGLRWLRDAKQRFWLVGYLHALATSLAVLFVVTRGWGDMAAYCDALTLPHVGFFAAVAAGVTLLAWAPPMPWPGIVLGFGLAGGAGLAVFGLASPQCLRTPFGALDPMVRSFWYDNVLEGKPIWVQSALVYPQLIQVVAGLAVAAAMLRKASGWKRSWWTDYLLVFAGSALLGLLVWRSMAFAAALAALPLGWLLKQGLETFRRSPRPMQRIGVLVGMFAVLMPSVPFLAGQKLLAQTGATAGSEIGLSRCELFASAEALGRLEPATVFAPLDIGPAILQRSPHAVVATGHHRAEAAMRDVISAFIGTPEQAHAIIERHGARYVVMCTDLMEPAIYRRRGVDNGFAAQLLDGEELQWLEPVELGTPETFRVWRVVD